MSFAADPAARMDDQATRRFSSLHPGRSSVVLAHPPGGLGRGRFPRDFAAGVVARGALSVTTTQEVRWDRAHASPTSTTR